MTLPPYGPAPVPPVKYRPRARLFVVGGALVVLAAVVFVGSLLLVLRPLSQDDAVFDVDDSPVIVEVPAGEERALFTRELEPVDCTVTDADGAPVELERISGDFTYNDWTAWRRFQTGAGDVVLDCDSPVAGSEVRVAQVPSTGTFVTGILVAVLVPLALGFAGVVVLVVTGILYAVRPPRP